MDKYFEELSVIYENLDFKSSYGEDYQPNIEQLKSEANSMCYGIEEMISGLITFYKREKNGFFNNPNDMNKFESIKSIRDRLKPVLAQYSQFKD